MQPGQDEERDEEREGQEDEQPGEQRLPARTGRPAASATAPKYDRLSNTLPHGHDHEQHGVVERAREQVQDRRRDPERERGPEAPAVQPHRLGDELADGALGGRERRRQRRHGAGRYRAAMSYTVFSPDTNEWQDRDDGSGRQVARFSDSMTQARANLWRYPAGSRGKRHADKVQEETFVIVAGSPSMYLGEPPERVDLAPGSVVVVQPGTPLQIWNHGADEATLFIVGAPPEQAGADFLSDVDA